MQEGPARTAVAERHNLFPVDDFKYVTKQASFCFPTSKSPSIYVAVPDLVVPGRPQIGMT